jgi:hypothetical protein
MERPPAERVQAARLLAIEGLAKRIGAVVFNFAEKVPTKTEREPLMVTGLENAVDADLIRAFTELCGAAEKAANAPDLKELDILGQKLKALTEKNEALHRAASRRRAPGEVKLG